MKVNKNSIFIFHDFEDTKEKKNFDKKIINFKF